jgi:hypothetical protein
MQAKKRPQTHGLIFFFVVVKMFHQSGTLQQLEAFG